MQIYTITTTARPGFTFDYHEGGTYVEQVQGLANARVAMNEEVKWGGTLQSTITDADNAIVHTKTGDFA